MNVAELAERSQLNGGLHVAFKQHRQHDNAGRRGAAQTGIDPDISAGHVGNQNALLLPGALAHQPLPDRELPWNTVLLVDGVARQQIQNGFVVLGVGDVEGSVLRAYQRRQLGEQKLRHS